MRAVHRRGPPQLVDLAHLVGDLDIRLGRHLLADQPHREDRREVFGTRRLHRPGVERRRRVAGQVRHQVDPMRRDLRLGQQDLGVARHLASVVRGQRSLSSAIRSKAHAVGPVRRERSVSCAPPMELSALRVAGLVAGVAVIGFAVWRRRSLRNADVLILFFAGLALAVVAATELTDALLEFFSFRKGGGGRILGLAVFAIFILFFLTLRNMALTGRVDRELSAVLEGIAWEEFRTAHLPERFKDKVAVVVPAYNEEDNIGAVLPRIPSSVCGVETAVLVVDDGSRDRTGEIARAHGAAVARHVINRGGGAALRTGYRLMSDSAAAVVVTLDADGQHLPEEMSRLVRPVLDGEVDVAHGSRVLGHAEPNHYAREMGIVFFNRMVSFITRTKVSDCSNGYRAVRSTVLPQLVLRQEQFHTSEFMIEAIKRGVPAKEIPITVTKRLHGHSKKPAVIRYGLGFANAIVRTWLR